MSVDSDKISAQCFCESTAVQRSLLGHLYLLLRKLNNTYRDRAMKRRATRNANMWRKAINLSNIQLRSTGKCCFVLHKASPMFFLLISLVYSTSISDAVKEIYMKYSVPVNSFATFHYYGYCISHMLEIKYSSKVK